MNSESTIAAQSFISSSSQRSGEGYFRALFGSMLLSLVLLTSAHLAIQQAGGKVPPWLSIIAAAVPLVYYHLIYLRPRARWGLSQSAIDSVYYFGFLITVAALGISALSIASAGAATNLDTVIFQFGVGLFATGYAVVARMHLSSISKMLDDASPDAVIDKYIQKSKLLVDNLDVTLHSFSSLSTRSQAAVEGLDRLAATIMAKTEETAARAQLLATRSVNESASLFGEEVRTVLAGTKESVAELRSMISATSFTVEREELARSVTSTIETTSKLNQEMATFIKTLATGTESFSDASKASQQLSLGVATLTRDIERLAGGEGTLTPAANAMSEATALIAQGASSLRTTMTGLNALAEEVMEGASTHHKFSRSFKKVDEQLTRLADVSTRFGEVLDGVQSATQGSEKSLQAITTLAATIPQLNDSALRLTSAFDAAVVGAERASDAVHLVPTYAEVSNRAAESIVASLQSVAETLRSAASDAAAFKSGTEAATVTLDGAHKLLSLADALSTALKGIELSATAFPAAMQRIEAELSHGAGQINQRITESANRLSADVERSSAAASLFTDKLVEVAEGVVARTRSTQPFAPQQPQPGRSS